MKMTVYKNVYKTLYWMRFLTISEFVMLETNALYEVLKAKYKAYSTDAW